MEKSCREKWQGKNPTFLMIFLFLRVLLYTPDFLFSGEKYDASDELRYNLATVASSKKTGCSGPEYDV